MEYKKKVGKNFRLKKIKEIGHSKRKHNLHNLHNLCTAFVFLRHFWNNWQKVSSSVWDRGQYYYFSYKFPINPALFTIKTRLPSLFLSAIYALIPISRHVWVWFILTNKCKCILSALLDYTNGGIMHTFFSHIFHIFFSWIFLLTLYLDGDLFISINKVLSHLSFLSFFFFW